MQPKQDTLKMRLVFLKHYYGNNELMYRKWEKSNIGKSKRIWNEKALMAHEISYHIEQILKEIDNGKITELK